MKNEKRKHDFFDPHGFNVDPELLAHDLTILIMSKRNDFEKLSIADVYNIYTQTLDKVELEIETARPFI